MGNARNDVIDWLKVPHIPYLQQVEIIREWLEQERTGRRLMEDGTVEEFTCRHVDLVAAVRGDSTGGTGDAPNEMLQQHSGLPVGSDSFVQFTPQSKDRLYTGFEQALFKDEGDPDRFSYPADHPLTSEFEEQMTALVREYKGQGEYLSVHQPDEQGAKDDAPDATALMLDGAAGGRLGDILFG